MFVCADCGQLHAPTDPTAGHPTRRNAEAPTRPDAPCTHCASREWIDLSDVAMADALRDSERADEQARPHALTAVLTPLMTGLLGGLSMAVIESSIFGGPGAWNGSAIPLWPFVAVAFFGVALVDRLRRHRKGTRHLPRRWSMSPVRASGPRARGRARGADVLSAPLTGRPCLAYELAIHTSDEPHAALGDFTLVEQRCADLEVDGKPFRGRGVRLELRRQRVKLDPANDAHRRFMHVRGLEPVGDAFTVYETIVAPEASVAVSGTEAAATLRSAA